MSLLLVLGLGLVACEWRPSPSRSAADALSEGHGRIAWRGMLPCADCEGIDTLIVLEQRGKARRYELVEIFVAGPGSARFAENGTWQMDGAQLSLVGEDGATRHYALLRDGRLQPRDASGRAFRRRGDFLQPADAHGP